MMKGCLKGRDCVVPLPVNKTVTIGRSETCDLIVQCADVDCRHAVIEYDSVDNYFTIQDLNTVRGTCVNNCLIQDAKVRLVPGDIIQIGFGPSSVQYTFCQSDESPCQSPGYNTCQNIPSKRSSDSSEDSRNGNYNDFPFNPCNETRPKSGIMRSNTCSVAERLKASTRNITTAMGSLDRDSIQYLGQQKLEKRKLEDMEEHRTRLDIMQVENRQKDCQIKKLEQKVSSLRTQLETNQFDYDSVSSQICRLQCKLDSLQQGCPPPVMICPPTLPRPVQQVMNCQQNIWEPERSCTEPQTRSKSSLRNSWEDHYRCSSDQCCEIECLRRELDCCRKDRSILSGCVTQMQNEITIKDCTINRLTLDNENLKLELLKKEEEIALMLQNANNAPPPSPPSPVEEIEEEDIKPPPSTEPEPASPSKRKSSIRQSIKMEFPSFHKKMSNEDFSKAKEEYERKMHGMAEELENQKKCAIELEQTTKAFSKAKEEYERKIHGMAEELENQKKYAVESEQTTKTLIRLRKQLMKIISIHDIPDPACVKKKMLHDYNAPELTDDEIIEKLNQLLEDGSKIKLELDHVNRSLEECKRFDSIMLTLTKKLKEDLRVANKRSDIGLHDLQIFLKDDIHTVYNLLNMSNLTGIREIIVSMIETQLGFARDIAHSLEQAGVHVKLSNDGPCKHIDALADKLKECKLRMCEMKTKMEEMECRLTSELEKAKTRQEIEDCFKKKMEKFKKEYEQQSRDMLFCERARISELEGKIECLEQELQEKLETLCFFKKQEDRLRCEVESYKKIEAELRNEICGKNASRSRVEESMRNRHATEVDCLKEKISALNLTISSLQDRLCKANCKIKKLQCDANSRKLNSSGCEGEKPRSGDMTKIIGNYQQETNRLHCEAKSLREEIDRCHSLITERDCKIARLQLELSNALDKIDKAKSENGSTMALAELGAECKAEKHAQHIEKQRECIAELKQKAKELEKVHEGHNTKKTKDCKDDRKFSCDEKVSLTVSPKEHRSSLKDRDSGKSSTDSFISKLSAQFGSNITAVLPDEDDHSNFSPMMHDNDKSLLKLSEAFYVELLETIFTQLKFASPAQYVIATFSLAMANDNSRVIKSRCELGCILASKLCDIYEKIEHQDKIICRLESELEGYRYSDDKDCGNNGESLKSMCKVMSLQDEITCLNSKLTQIRSQLEKEKKASTDVKLKKTSCGSDYRRNKETNTGKHSCILDDRCPKTACNTKKRFDSFELLQKKDCEILRMKEEICQLRRPTSSRPSSAPRKNCFLSDEDKAPQLQLTEITTDISCEPEVDPKPNVTGQLTHLSSVVSQPVINCQVPDVSCLADVNSQSTVNCQLDANTQPANKYQSDVNVQPANKYQSDVNVQPAVNCQTDVGSKTAIKSQLSTTSCKSKD